MILCLMCTYILFLEVSNSKSDFFSSSFSSFRSSNLQTHRLLMFIIFIPFITTNNKHFQRLCYAQKRRKCKGKSAFGQVLRIQLTFLQIIHDPDDNETVYHTLPLQWPNSVKYQQIRKRMVIHQKCQVLLRCLDPLQYLCIGCVHNIRELLA